MGALVQANIPVVAAWAKENNVEFTSDEDLCSNTKVRKEVTNALNKIGKGNLSPLEVLQSVHLIAGTGPSSFPGDVHSPWTPENGFLTASNKTDRTAIRHGKHGKVDGKATVS